ncbi:MAG: TonB family protein [Candidatus Eisenbacteria bacterium]
MKPLSFDRAAALLLCASWLFLPALAPRARAGEGVNPIQLLQEMAETEGDDERRAKCAEALGRGAAPFVETFCNGYDAIYQGFDQVASEYLELTLKQKPDFALACILYGDAYHSLGKLDQAEQYYRRAVAMQPQRIDARFSLGRVLMERGQSEPKYLAEALEAFRQMTEENPASSEGWSNMANVLVYMNRLDDAESIYKKALEKDPNDPFLYDQMASLYLRKGRTTDAEENWKRSLAESASYGPAVVELAGLYGRAGRLIDALETMEKGRQAVVAPPWGPRIRRNLGFLYLALGDRDRASDLLLDAWNQGSDPLATLGLAHLKLIAGDDARGLKYLERGTTLDASLALPFLEAWRGKLTDALKSTEYPALVVARKALASPKGAEGAAATESLVAFVLENWSFAGIESAKDKLLDRPTEGASAEYDTPPVALEKVAAVYPESAQERGLEGQVTVLVTIDEQGKVIAARVDKSRAEAELEEAALSAARKWTFSPAMRYGQPVRSTMSLPFRFSRAKN